MKCKFLNCLVSLHTLSIQMWKRVIIPALTYDKSDKVRLLDLYTQFYHQIVSVRKFNCAIFFVVFMQVPQIAAPQVSVPMAPNFLLPSSGCFWSGTSPFCIAACGKNFHAVLTDIRGDGKRCWTGFKKRCCPIPSGMIKIKGDVSLWKSNETLSSRRRCISFSISFSIDF